MSTNNPKHILQHNEIRLFLKYWTLVLLMSGTLLTTASAQGSVPINPISFFQVQEGSSAVSWSQTGATLDPSTGNSIITFQDSNGGTSTMTWSSTGSLASWTINLAAGSSETYIDGTAQGQPGSFVLTGGSVGTCTVLSINGHPYIINNNILLPSQTRPGDNDFSFAYFTYNGINYPEAAVGTDYIGRSLKYYGSANGGCISTQTQGFQIYLPDGTCANYSKDSIGRTYTYQSSSTAPNALTQINGYALKTVGNRLSLPTPIVSFVINDAYGPYTLISVYFNAGGSSSLIAICANSIDDEAQIYVNQDGTLGHMDAGTEEGQIYLAPGQNPNTYQYTEPSPGTQITAINNIPYVLQGSLLVPQGPVSGFTYGGNAYQFTGYSQASDGNWLTQYQTSGANPVTASVEYSPSSDAIVKMKINTAGGGTAVYVDGASVGQPGAYVWSNTSTAANLLSAVNGSTYNPTGDSDLPGTAQTTNGVFQIKGNFMSLGTWYNNANQSGFDLAYYDGQTTAPSSVEFTASRPSSAWVWDATTADGTMVNPMMQLDESSRLLLYPIATAGATAGAAGPTPAVILDPSASNASDFSGVVRFEGPVRIAPQGDLSMGTFTQDTFPAQPTQ